jgi:mannose/fructose/N-acetylgalactosamine-specific phosphotransferase system component IID
MRHQVDSLVTEQRARAKPTRDLTAKVLARCFLRCYVVGSAFNTRGMQNVGLAYAMDPGLEAIHGPGPELQRARKRHVGHYNTHPFWTPLLVGIFLSMERKIARGLFPLQMMENVRGTTTYTLSAIGDSFFAGSILVFWSLITVCLLVLGRTSEALWLGAVCFAGLQAFKAVTLFYGVREGLNVLHRLKRWGLIDWSQRIKQVNGALLACLWYLLWPPRVTTESWLAFVGAMAVLAWAMRKTNVSREILAALLLAVYLGYPWLRNVWAWLP